MSNWFTKSHDGDFSVDDDAPQSGGPAEVDSDQTETIIKNNQCYSMRKIADILKISKLIKLLVKMKNVSFILWKKNIQTFWPIQYNGEYMILYICPSP